MKIEPSAVEGFGDRAILVRFGDPPSHELTTLLTGLAQAAAKLPGVIDAAPGLTTVLIESDLANLSGLKEQIPSLLSSAKPLEGLVFEVPVDYDGEDLEWVCGHLGLPADELIALHSEPVYDVRLLGSPGFIYLSDVSPRIAVPRLEQPRKHVAGGSVGIGGTQAGIYGRPRPGGWRIIATTVEVPRVRPGDRVKFVPS